jgi:hypothetical protein
MFYTMHVRVGKTVRVGYFLFGKLVYTSRRVQFYI